MPKKQNPMIVGQPVLIVVDIQKVGFDDDGTIPLMPGMVERMRKARTVIDAAREGGVPIIFLQESHRKSGVDYGREMDGDEDMHLREDWPGTAIAAEEVGLRDDDYTIVKRRYSGFIGTDLSILLRGLKAETLILVGGLTNICVHYTFADGHQSDYHCRVVEDCVAGSSIEAHDAALNNMEYLQHGARRTAAEINEAFLAFKQGKAA
ncbi:cysteine hydrolase family protein [Neorhizobium alkalisoli]|jgi:nicotinamidase-related amidase|uniref:Nicotinamidase-related amidase n=1 Tax=Neorhizobium alkalisoli TaxID=528178 RepID=A0A561QPW2_9HYPH|nr:isochorismatase family cysteine hydrolase [Neorhizobium alkalisoli]TWF52326.1 nicotinamidase-related amidase [Neorhizobium alkalisoli]